MPLQLSLLIDILLQKNMNNIIILSIILVKYYSASGLGY
jgi:hypothetical protein